MSRNTKFPGTFRNSTLRKTGIAVGVSTVVLSAGLVHAAEEDKDSVNLDKLQIEERTLDANPYSEPGAPYKANRSGDVRYTRPLAETPKNIQVLTKTQIEDSGATDLRDILDAQPGITLGTGENGNQFGDRYIIRGQEARSDVFVDGLRDPGMTTRESFATEQIEITKGPDSSFAGRGTAGGAVNSITKQASSEENFTKLSTGFGTDKYSRVTLDTNQVLTDQFALRANALYAYEDIPSRAPANKERKGLALSGAYEASDELNVVVDYYGLRANDRPDLGSFLSGTNPNRLPVDDAPVYAQEEDFQDSEVDIFTARVNYDLNSDMKVYNVTRAGKTSNGYIVTGAGSSTTSDVDLEGNAIDAYETITLSTHAASQEVEYFATQTNLLWEKEAFGFDHELIFGFEYSDNKVVNSRYNITTNGDTNCIVAGRGGVAEGYCGVDASGNTVSNLNTLLDRSYTDGEESSDWAARTFSFSVMDTVDLTDTVTAFAGLRGDIYDYKLVASGRGGLTEADDSGELVNGHLGATWNFSPEANVYATFSSATDINGGESDVGTNSGYGGYIADAGDPSPETTRNLELGTKWNLFDGKLLATGALFDIQKTDVMEGNGYTETGTANSGANQVQGFELSFSGNITDKLSGTAGIAIMKSEVTESIDEANIGKVLSNFADNSAAIQLKYAVTDDFSIGGAIKYESEKYAGQPDTAAGADRDNPEYYAQPVPEYTVADLFANYQITSDMDVRVNIGNISNEDYYLAAYRSGAFLYKGDERNIRLTLDYSFR